MPDYVSELYLFYLMYASIKQYYIDLSKELPLFRTAFAVSLALIYATTVGYPLAHTTAIFTIMFIGPGKQAVKFKDVLVYPIALYVLGMLGVYVGYVLLDYIVVTLLVLGLAIFWSFRLTKIPVPARLLFLIFVILLPLLSMSANGLGEFVLAALITNLAIALIIVKFSFLLFPQTLTAHSAVAQSASKDNAGPSLNMDKVAFNGLMVIFPLLCYYYFSQDPDILILVFVALLAFDPFIAQSNKGFFMLIANLWGGLIGIIAYQVLIVAPYYPLYIFLCITICFYFIINIYAGKKTSPIYSTSFNTFFIVMATVSSSTNTASGKVWDRVFQIGLALIYTIVAYRIVNHFNNPKNQKIEK